MIIAQLTDTHIRAGAAPAYGKVDTTAALRAAVDHINRLDPAPHCVVVSGDLVDFGTAEEYEAFLSLVEPLNMPLWPVPGNHDSERMWDFFPEAAGLRPAEGLCYRVDVGEVSLVLFDSSMPGSPQGMASAERCDVLHRTLKDIGARPSLLFLHHPPFRTGIAHMDVNNCHGADLLARTVESFENLLAIGCGHVHRYISATVGGKRTLIAPSPAHSVSLDLREGAPPTFHMEPPSILLHRIVREADGSTSHVSHQSFIGGWPGPYPFFKEDGSLV